MTYIIASTITACNPDPEVSTWGGVRFRTLPPEFGFTVTTWDPERQDEVRETHWNTKDERGAGDGEVGRITVRAATEQERVAGQLQHAAANGRAPGALGKSLVCVEAQCWFCGRRFLLPVSGVPDDRRCSCGAAREWDAWTWSEGSWVSVRSLADTRAAAGRVIDAARALMDYASETGKVVGPLHVALSEALDTFDGAG